MSLVCSTALSFGDLKGISRLWNAYILNDYESSCESRLEELHLLPLMYTYELNNLMFLIKCLNQLSDHFNIHQYINLPQVLPDLETATSWYILTHSHPYISTFKLTELSDYGTIYHLWTHLYQLINLSWISLERILIYHVQCIYWLSFLPVPSFISIIHLSQ